MADSDTANNRTDYLLSDAMGGHVGVLHGVDPALPPFASGGGGGSSPPVLVMQPYDAFGVAMGPGRGGPGSLAWRGVEGSPTDGDGLVYMQSRHYDPTLGRFLQSDSLPLASLTTQGVNRYIYCENDPVNRSDPSGMSFWSALAGIGLMVAGVGSLMFGLWGLAGVAGFTAASVLALLSFASFGLLAMSLFHKGLSYLLTDPHKRCFALNVSEESGVLGDLLTPLSWGRFLSSGLSYALRSSAIEAASFWAMEALQGGLEWVGDRW